MATRLFSVVVAAADPARLAAWWSRALDWPVTYESPDESVVEPDGNDETEEVPALVFVRVDDPKTTKNRVHLDLASDSEEHEQELVDRLRAAGASPVDIGQGDKPWTVLADPEGNEFCVLGPHERWSGRGPLAAIVVDAVDPARLARFWVEASGWPIGYDRDGVVSLHNPGGGLPDLEFVAVDHPKLVKNRVHLDVAPRPDDDRDLEVARLEELGARRVDVGQGPDVTWVVLVDPEGQEFCVLRPR